MKLPHRQLVHLAPGAAALPVAARVARAQLCIISLVGLVWSFEAKAQVQDCTKALVKATVVSNTLDITNLSIAWSLSEDAYNEAKTNAGASAVIYGVPMGANYGEFRRNIQTRAESLNIQKFQLRANAYATSGIDQNSLDAYKSCLLSNGGLAVVAGAMGTNSYVIWIVYYPPINGRPNLTGRVSSTQNLSSSSAQLLRSEVKRTSFGLVDSQFIITPENIEKEASVGVVVGHQARSLLLPPLSVPISTEKICRVIFHRNDNDPKNFTNPMPSSAGTHDCARFAQKYIPEATDVRVGCRQGPDRVGEQRFAITPGHGYDPHLSAAGPPFGPQPNCGWD
jgi:hypothetical protein